MAATRRILPNTLPRMLPRRILFWERCCMFVNGDADKCGVGNNDTFGKNIGVDVRGSGGGNCVGDVEAAGIGGTDKGTADGDKRKGG